MSKFTTMESLKAFGFKQILKYFDSDPDKNVPKILDWISKIDKKGTVVPQVSKFNEVIKDPDNNWCQMIRKVWNEYDDGVRRRFFENFIVYASIIGGERRKALRVEHNCNVPWAILLDPTSACNLHCTGCWASEYGHKLNLSYETIDNIVEQGKAMGTYMYIYTGGEPLVRKDDIIRLCEKHTECYFLCFTNGTLIDDAFADEMLRVQNFIPSISVEGFEEATDYRRGTGTYNKVIKAMDILRNKRLPFGISCCYTSKNCDSIISEEFFDEMIARGALFAWMFTYMPVGANAVPELMASAEQREYMFYKIREYRNTKPIFTLDFWNDAEYVGGCIAGGKNYLHINANGDIEPCVFVHYSDSSIYEKTLLEAYKSPMFMQYHNNQPFNDNMLRPCPILDNKGVLAKMVKEAGAKCTNLESQEAADVLCNKCDTTADRWAPVAEKLWDSYPHKEKK